MVSEVLIFENIIYAGACARGVIEKCKEANNTFICTLEEALEKFQGHESLILRAAGADGYGYVAGAGYGYGYVDE